jgi:hypothetical protein
MNSGSSPCAPRYWLSVEAAACWPAPPPAVSDPPPENRSVAEPPTAVSSAITCSTGPPGANCTTTKLTSMIPNRVGIISASLLRI